MKLNIVPARTGFLWVQLGMQTFMKQPLALASLLFMYGLLALALLFVPLIGPFLMAGLFQVATLGIMAATRVAETGAFPMPSLMFTALRGGRERTLSMLLLCALYAASLLVLVLLVLPMMPTPPEGKTWFDMAESGELLAPTLLFQAFYLPVALAFWHAPALVFWYGVSPVKSVFFSLVACVRNGRAFLVYGLAWAGVSLAIVLASAFAAAISPWLAGVVSGAAGTMATIVFYTSIYFSFRDSFLDA